MLSQPGVERGKRLVQQQDVRLHCEGSGKSDPLALAARQLCGIAVVLTGQSNEIQKVADSSGSLCSASPFQSEFYVFAHGQVRKQSIVLKYGANVTLIRLELIDPHAIEKHIPLGWLFKSSYQAERCGLSATRRSEQRKERATLDAERNFVDRKV